VCVLTVIKFETKTNSFVLVGVVEMALFNVMSYLPQVTDVSLYSPVHIVIIAVQKTFDI